MVLNETVTNYIQTRTKQTPRYHLSDKKYMNKQLKGKNYEWINTSTPRDSQQ